MADKSKVTTDHQEIRDWVQKHDGQPQLMDHLGNGHGNPGLRIDFPGKEDEEYLSEADMVQRVGWEDFFKQFEVQSLAFEYEEEAGLNDPSNAYRFIKRENITEED